MFCDDLDGCDGGAWGGEVEQEGSSRGRGYMFIQI